MSELDESIIVKRRRGRPKKIVSLEQQSESSSLSTSPNASPEPVKKLRGRPAKYDPEERKEKYKELRSKWSTENFLYKKEQSKDIHRYHKKFETMLFNILSRYYSEGKIKFSDNNEEEVFKRWCGKKL
jgi:hypothetical protein